MLHPFNVFVCLYLVVNLFNESIFCRHFAYQIKNGNIYQWKKITYSEIYKILSFEKKKFITTKLLCPQNNLIIITGSAKQCGAQI